MNIQIENSSWCRICSCGRKIIYKNHRSAIISTKYKSNNTCRSCSQEGKKNRNFGKECKWNRLQKSAETIRRLSDSHKEKTFSLEHRKNISKGLIGNTHSLGFHHSEESKEKMRNKVVSDETKEKLRRHRWHQICRLGTKSSNFNPKACIFIDRLNVMIGINLIHAKSGGEQKISWYSVDGYDREKNIVFEYDERHHNTESVKKKDVIRQNRIIKKVSPRLFLRYNEAEDKLYDAITLKEIKII